MVTGECICIPHPKKKEKDKVKDILTSLIYLTEALKISETFSFS